MSTPTTGGDRERRRPTVVIVDADGDFRSALTRLAAAAGLEVVGTADDLARARPAVLTSRPDLVLLDIDELDATIDAAEHLRRTENPPRVLLMSTGEAEDHGQRLAAALSSGVAETFVSKADLTTDLLTRWADESRPLSVVIAEDSALLREGIAALLTRHGFEVLAQVGDGTELLAAVAEHLPDVALTDIRMPPTSTDEGLRAADAIAVSHPSVGVLVLSEYLEPEYARRLFQAGTPGRGYILKGTVAEVGQVTTAIRRVAAGESVLGPRIVAELLEDSSVHELISELTIREHQILGLAAEGLTNRAIASRLFLSERTVESHVRTALRKMGIPDTPDDHRRVLAVLAYVRGR